MTPKSLVRLTRERSKTNIVSEKPCLLEGTGKVSNMFTTEWRGHISIIITGG